MIFRRKSLAVLAVLVAIGAAPLQSASAASVDRAFAAAVAKVLSTVPYVVKLGPAEKRAFVACAQGIMNTLPDKQKQYVLAASNAADMRKRFNDVSTKRPIDNSPTLKQQVGANCS